MNIKMWLKVVSCAALWTVLGATETRAQQAPEKPVTSETTQQGTGLDEVVVTAQKRSEHLQDAPLAVTAVTGANLEARHVLDMQNLAEAIPNFDFGIYSGNAHLAVRGLGFDSVNPGAEARIAFHSDGVYVSRPADVLGTFFDVARVEILRGPQGTLYGRNATGGSINVITNNPTRTPEGYFRETVGNFSQTMEEGAVSGPMGDLVSGRLALQVNNRNGYGHNLVTGQEIDNAKTWSLRGKLAFQFSDRFDLLFSADYHSEDDASNGFHYMGPGNPIVTPTGVLLGAPSLANSYDIATAEDPINKRSIWGASAVATWQLSDTMTMRSITGYRYSKYQDFSDATGEGFNLLPFNQVERSRSESEELQLSQSTEKYHWIAGLYYFHEKIESFSQAATSAGLFGGPVNTMLQGYWAGGTLTTSAAAGFGQLTYNVSPRLAATLGLRYGSEHKSVDDGLQFDLARVYSPSNALNLLATQKDSLTENAFTPKASLDYRLSPSVLTYLSVSKGYKSGGFDNGAVAPPYGAEKVVAYELGLKGEWLERRLQTNLAAFYYDASDLQASVIVNTAVLTKNAARAKAKGFEAEVNAIPARGWKTDLAIGYLDSTYASFTTADPQRPQLGVLDLSGYRLPQAPTATAEVGLQHTWEMQQAGSLTFRVEGYYVSKIYFTPFNVDVNAMGGHSKENAFINYLSANGHWSAQVFGRNLTDKKIIAYSTPTSGFDGYPVVGYLEPHRTYGVIFGYQF